MIGCNNIGTASFVLFLFGLFKTSLTADPIGLGPHSFDYIIGEDQNFQTPANVVFVDYEISPSVIRQLKNAGKRVFCYINAGAWEEWRSDASQFPEHILGNDYDGWPGERWLDIRQIDIIMDIMWSRLEIASAAGCEGIEPDNINGFEINTGFPLTYADQLTYNSEFAYSCKDFNLLVGLKNDGTQAADLVWDFDFVVAESCMVWDECSLFNVFINQNKPVFAVEYTHSWDEDDFIDTVCPQMGSTKMPFILKDDDVHNDYTYSCFWGRNGAMKNKTADNNDTDTELSPSLISNANNNA